MAQNGTHNFVGDLEYCLDPGILKDILSLPDRTIFSIHIPPYLIVRHCLV